MKGQTMFSLMRMTFWGALVLLLLPIDRNGDAAHVDLASPIAAVSTVREMVADLGAMCDRKPDLCRRGSELASTLAARAREGARVAYKALDDHLAEPDRSIVTGSIRKP